MVTRSRPSCLGVRTSDLAGCRSRRVGNRGGAESALVALAVQLAARLAVPFRPQAQLRTWVHIWGLRLKLGNVNDSRDGRRTEPPTPRPADGAKCRRVRQCAQQS